MKPFLLFILFLFSLVTMTKTNSLTVNKIIYHQIRQDTTNSSTDLVQKKRIDAEDLLKQQVLKWQSERIIHINDSLPDFFSDDILILLNGEKVKDLHQISNPKLVKYIKVLKNEQIPKRYRKRGIKSVLKIKTKKN